MVDVDELFMLRSAKVLALIKEKGEGLVVKDPASDDEAEWSNVEVARYIGAAIDDVRTSFKDLVRELSAGSTRRMLSLWDETLSSRSLQTHYFHKKREKGFASDRGTEAAPKDTKSAFVHITHYPWSDALITGKYKFHNSLRSPIPNIFLSIGYVDTAYDLLLGPHLLHLLATRCNPKQLAHASDFSSILAALGL